ncbi:MAG: hypothetical protein MJ200_00230 [Mycoplasmoidaceae bacterium]|nr:hypothetical protein [Mycoplasmoidaceae bacterium]
MFLFICGEDISSSENYMGISGQFFAFFNNYEITTNNLSSSGMNLAYVQPGYKELFDGSMRNGEFTFV